MGKQPCRGRLKGWGHRTRARAPFQGQRASSQPRPCACRLDQRAAHPPCASSIRGGCRRPGLARPPLADAALPGRRCARSPAKKKGGALSFSGPPVVFETSACVRITMRMGVVSMQRGHQAHHGPGRGKKEELASVRPSDDDSAARAGDGWGSSDEGAGSKAWAAAHCMHGRGEGKRSRGARTLRAPAFRALCRGDWGCIAAAEASQPGWSDSARRPSALGCERQ